MFLQVVWWYWRQPDNSRRCFTFESSLVWFVALQQLLFASGQRREELKNNHATADPTHSSDLAASGNRLRTRTDHGLDIPFGIRAHQPHTVCHIKIAKLAAFVSVLCRRRSTGIHMRSSNMIARASPMRNSHMKRFGNCAHGAVRFRCNDGACSRPRWLRPRVLLERLSVRTDGRLGVARLRLRVAPNGLLYLLWPSHLLSRGVHSARWRL